LKADVTVIGGGVVGLCCAWALVATGHGTKGVSLGPLTGLLVARVLEGRGTGELGRALGPDRFG
jgi:glycine/D-amino acid oxidase-like deaminating enzyme